MADDMAELQQSRRSMAGSSSITTLCCMAALCACSSLGCSEHRSQGHLASLLPESESNVESASQALSSKLKSEHAVPERVRRATLETALRLVTLAADSLGDNARNGLEDTDPDDGGWDFVLPLTAPAHTERRSPENTYGATALGLWSARSAWGAPRECSHVETPSGRPRLTTALVDAALGCSRRAEVDSSPDVVFLVELSEQDENPGYAELARQRYEAAKTRAGGLAELVNSLVARRVQPALDGLVPYDLAWLGLAAAALSRAFPSAGYAAEVSAIAESCAARSGLLESATEPAVFDIENRAESFYVQGLAGTVLALSLTAPDHGAARYAALNRVRRILYDEQLPNGSFGYNSTYPEPNLQSTAHAVMALALASGAQTARSRAERAATWLARQYLIGGGFEASPGQESPLLDAEILLALRLAFSSSTGDQLTEIDESREGRAASRDSEEVAQASSALSVARAQPSLGSPASLGSAND